jgi:hypothetical protein
LQLPFYRAQEQAEAISGIGIGLPGLDLAHRAIEVWRGGGGLF